MLDLAPVSRPTARSSTSSRRHRISMLQGGDQLPPCGNSPLISRSSQHGRAGVSRARDPRSSRHSRPRHVSSRRSPWRSTSRAASASSIIFIGDLLARAGAAGLTADEVVVACRSSSANRGGSHDAVVERLPPGHRRSGRQVRNEQRRNRLLVLGVIGTGRPGAAGGAALVRRPPVLAGVYFAYALKVAAQWQKAAVLRLGR